MSSCGRPVTRCSRLRRWLLLILLLWTPLLFVWLVGVTRQHTQYAKYLSELHKCPVCYGQTMCRQVNADDLVTSARPADIGVSSSSKERRLLLLPPVPALSSPWSFIWSLVLSSVNVKNVFYGRLAGAHVVFKKLAHSSHLDQFDRQVCCAAGDDLVASCAAQRAALYQRMLDNMFLSVSNASATATHFVRSFDVAPAAAINRDHLTCPSRRTVKFLFDANKDDSPARFHHFSTMLFINPEPLILQAFSQNLGWPFARYIGSCGRVVAEQYIGPPLSLYYHSDWITRAQLALQLLEICDVMTAGDHDFSLYLTDVHADNLAVNVDEGRIYVVDVQNVVIVDRRQVMVEYPGTWNITHVSAVLCADCLAFEPEKLCQHTVSDHNYMAVCRCLLSSDCVTRQMPGGLLHEPPLWVLDTHPELVTALQLCSDPRLAPSSSPDSLSNADVAGGDTLSDLHWATQPDMSRIKAAGRLSQVLNRILAEVS